MTIRHLDTLFHPRSVAVIGGSSRAGTLGAMVLGNIIDGGFAGTIYAVNPNRVELDDVWWVDSVAALPQAPDLAVIVTPAATVPDLIAELGTRGSHVAVVISAGLQEPVLRAAMLEAAQAHQVRLVGPNCLGVLMPHAKLNASFAPRVAQPGRLAFVSQSGALVTAMLDWAANRHVGFSAVVSAGDMADADLGDLVDILAADVHTDAILLYIEGVTDSAKFLSAARAAARAKPVIAIKAGRTNAAGKAAMSHTGALVGAYDVYAAALQRAGVVLVDTLTELFDAAQVLCRHRANCGKRLAIVTNGGGAGVLAADALAPTGGTLAALAPDTIAALDPAMPPAWSRANPLDVVGDARPERFAAATEAVLADPGVDALLVMHCPTAVATGTEAAGGVVRAIARAGLRKPVIACWMGPENATAARPIFDRAGIPLFDNLDDAVRGYGYLLRASEAQRALMRAPSHASVPAADKAAAARTIGAARAEGRTVLSAAETRLILAAYGVPVVQSRVVETADALAEACAAVPGPWALKLVSPDLTHKSDVGGVVLGLEQPDTVVAAARAMRTRIAAEHPQARIEGFELQTMVSPDHAIELLLGLSGDATFGPVLAFGAGGKAVELLHDRALGLPPLDDDLARAMIAQTRVSRLMAGYRDVPAVDVAGVVRALNALSALAVDFPDLLELDINPLIATPRGVLALDGRARISAEPAPASRLVIRPVPAEWTADLVTRSGLALHVRPVHPDDEDAVAELFRHVTPEDLRFRFLSGLREVGRDRLVAMTQIDYRRTMHFLAFAGDLLVGSAILAADPDHVRAELAISVRADFKGKGVSWTLVEHVLRFAAAEGIRTVESLESAENHAALALEREAGFQLVPSPDSPAEILVRRQVASIS